jgi:AhpD family alkylhydroperoxidase
MQQRIDAAKVSPAAYKAMAGLQGYVDQSSLEPSLRDLVKIRASQINGCAYCLVMHTNDARKRGETDERMHLLNAWPEAPVFTARERTALAWVEAVTLITDGHVPDDVYEEARGEFLGTGAARPHRRDHRHQQLEPTCHRLPCHAAAPDDQGRRVTVTKARPTFRDML